MAQKIQFGINLNPRHPLGQPADASELLGLTWARVVYEAASVHQSVEQAFGFYDPLVSKYEGAGVRLLMVLNQQTHWGNAPWTIAEADGDDWNQYAQDFAGVAGQIAAHYRGRGVAYEIWNEGDLHGDSSVFVPGQQFAGVLSAAAAAIKAADPEATVVMGGLAAAPNLAVAYVSEVQGALGGNLPVDAIGAHPYGKWPPNFRQRPGWGGWFGALNPHLKLFADNFPNAPIWITEVGISEHVPFPPEQWPMVIDYMRGVFNLVQKSYSRRIPVVIWFAWSDAMRNAGLVDFGGVPKGEVYQTFFELARAEPPTEPEIEVDELPDPEDVVFPPLGALTPTTDLNVRSGAGVDFRRVTTVRPGDRLEVAEAWESAFLKLGRKGHWIHLTTPQGQEGWAAAWFLEMAPQEAPGAAPEAILLTPTTDLNVRQGFGTEFPQVGAVRPGDKLVPLEKPANVLAKLGRRGQWIHLRTPGGLEGWSAAWLLRRLPQEAPTPMEEPLPAPPEAPPAEEPEPAPPETLLVTPTTGLNVRSGPGTGHGVVVAVTAGTRLEVVEDPQQALAKLGRQGEWIQLRTPEGKRGWSAAWLLKRASEADFLGIGRLAIAPPEARIAMVADNDLNVRGGPGQHFAEVDKASANERLEALEPQEIVTAKLGRQGNWVRLRTPRGIEGWAAAWLLRAAPDGGPAQPPQPAPVDPRRPRTTRITMAQSAALPPDAGEAGRLRALDFEHEPVYTLLPVCDPKAILNFSGFGPNNFSYRIHDGDDFYSNLCGLHNGLDFGVPEGTMLCSVDWGMVVYAGPKTYGAGPFNVIVRYGMYVTLYGHMNGVFSVKAGDIVAPGDELGRSGTAFGYPHLHFETRRIDPAYVDQLRQEAAGADDPLKEMNARFNIRGWHPVADHYVNPALFFDPPLESYWKDLGWKHADWLPADEDRNGFPDHARRFGETRHTAYDLYALSSIPPGPVFHFWRGSSPV